jgi:hypothetical protein
MWNKSMNSMSAGRREEMKGMDCGENLRNNQKMKKHIQFL